MANAFKWDYSKIKNFPEGGTIQRSGNGLIVIRRKTVYDPTIKRGKDAKREYLACILKVSKNQGGFDLLSPLDSSRMLGTWEIVS